MRRRLAGTVALALLWAARPGLAADESSDVRSGDASYRAGIERWRADREERLKADDGWLTVAGLFWLKEGENRAGTDPGSEVWLPEGSAPARAGVFELRDGKVRFRSEPSVAVTLAGQPAGAVELTPDSAGAPDVLTLGRLRMHVIRRGARHGVRLRDLQSASRRDFAGLEWFPVRDLYRVTARWIPHDPPRLLPVPNVLGDVQRMRSPGRAAFRLDGREFELHAVTETPDAGELFFIFRDETSGKETYAAGRFLYAGLPEDGRVVLDFNRAVSPPCAFTPYATCPLPPGGNRLKVRIEAGERATGHP